MVLAPEALGTHPPLLQLQAQYRNIIIVAITPLFHRTAQNGIRQLLRGVFLFFFQQLADPLGTGRRGSIGYQQQHIPLAQVTAAALGLHLGENPKRQ